MFLGRLMTGRHKLVSRLTVSRGRGFSTKETEDKREPNRNGLSMRFVIAPLDILTYLSTIVIYAAPFQWFVGEGNGLRAAATQGCLRDEIQSILLQTGRQTRAAIYDSLSVVSTEY